MVAAATKPNAAEVYKFLCTLLRTDATLAVVVVNHIAAKHAIHSLPAFHGSEAISDEDKLATYSELVKVLNAYVNNGDRNALAQLKGRVASGLAPANVEPRAEAALGPVARSASGCDLAEPDIHGVNPIGNDTKTRPVAEKPKPLPIPRVASDPLTDRFRELIIELLGELPSSSVDETQVREIAASIMQEREDTITSNVSKLVDAAVKAVGPTVVRHEFKVGEKLNSVEGLMHRQIPQVIAWLSAGVPVWLWGSAGASKTHSARQIAKAMGLPFYCIAIDETITVGKLVGFRNVANGEFVPGLVYKAYKEGGVVLFDEGDTNAATIASLNSMLANDHYTFPNGEEVARHKDFRVIFGANTKGTGAVAGYTARVRLDAATLDRFAVIKMDYDSELELAIACGVPTSGKTWKAVEPASEALCRNYVDWVQRVRAKVGDSVLISPRASYLGVRALRTGIPPAEVAEALVFKLVTPDTRTRIVNEAGTVPVK